MQQTTPHLRQAHLLQREADASHTQREGARERREGQLQVLHLGRCGLRAIKLAGPQHVLRQADAGGLEACEGRRRGEAGRQAGRQAWKRCNAAAVRAGSCRHHLQMRKCAVVWPGNSSGF